MGNWTDIKENITDTVKVIQENPVLDSIAKSVIEQIPIVGNLLIDIYESSKGKEEDKTAQILTILQNYAKMDENRLSETLQLLYANKKEILKNHNSLTKLVEDTTRILERLDSVHIKIDDNTEQLKKIEKKFNSDISSIRVYLEQLIKNIESINSENIIDNSKDKKILNLCIKANESFIPENLQQESSFLNEALKLNPQTCIALTVVAISLMIFGKYRESLHYYDKALMKDPFFDPARQCKVIALDVRAINLAEEKKYYDAEAYVDESLEIQPLRVETLINKARICLLLNHFSEALFYLDKSLELDPEDKSALAHKEFVLTQLGKNEQKIDYHSMSNTNNHVMEIIKKAISSVDSIIKQSDDYIFYQNYDKSEKLIALAVRKFPNSVEALKCKLLLLLKNQKYEEGLLVVEKLSLMKLNEPDVYRIMSQVFWRLKIFERTLELLNISLQIDPNHIESLRDKSVLLLQELHKPEEALVCIEPILEKDPKNVQALSMQATCLGFLNKFKDAISCFDDAINIDPTDGNLWANKAALLAKLKKNEDAVECYEKAIHLIPNQAIFLLNQGVSLIMLGDFDRALTVFDKADMINPNNPEILGWKSVAFAKLNKCDEANNYLTKAISLNPSDDTILTAKKIVDSLCNNSISTI